LRLRHPFVGPVPELVAVGSDLELEHEALGFGIGKLICNGVGFLCSIAPVFRIVKLGQGRQRVRPKPGS
jgi:hypothetical protein